jgi:hypothetical protein
MDGLRKERKGAVECRYTQQGSLEGGGNFEFQELNNYCTIETRHTDYFHFVKNSKLHYVDMKIGCFHSYLLPA